MQLQEYISPQNTTVLELELGETTLILSCHIFWINILLCGSISHSLNLFCSMGYWKHQL